jgi:iron-sulfur cluster repair protein YtfE (RIC family)
MNMPTTTNQIDPTISVNELVRRYPASLPVLSTLGIDSCCGGAKTLSAAAETAGITVDALLSSVTTATNAAKKDDHCNCGGHCSGDA